MHAVSGAAGGGEPGGDGRGEGWDAGAREGVEAAGGGCLDGTTAAGKGDEDVGVNSFITFIAAFLSAEYYGGRGC